MTSIMPQLAHIIMQQSVSEGEDQNAGPTFEQFPFEQGGINAELALIPRREVGYCDVRTLLPRHAGTRVYIASS